MIEETGRIMGKARYTVRVLLGKLVVVGPTHKDATSLGRATIESLRHDMVVKDESFRKLLKREPLSFVESMEVALKAKKSWSQKSICQPNGPPVIGRRGVKPLFTRFSGLQSRPVPTPFGSPTNTPDGCQAHEPPIRVEVNEKQDMLWDWTTNTPLELSYSQDRSPRPRPFILRAAFSQIRHQSVAKRCGGDLSFAKHPMGARSWRRSMISSPSYPGQSIGSHRHQFTYG